MKSEQLLSLIAAGLLLVVLLLVVSFHAAPQFTTYLLLLILLAFGFILTEQWKTHDAAEFENRFWTGLSFCFAATCLFCKDSPLKFPEERAGVAWSIICLCTYLCHIYDRDVRRLFLTRVNFIRKQRSSDFNAENRAQAKLKIVMLKKLTAAIDQRWVSSTFLNIFFLSYVLSAEDQILNALSEANRDELNLILNDSHFELALILYKVKDHWVCKRYHRTKLLQLLARERINDLSIRSRVVLLDAMQRLGVSAHSSLEEFIKNIIISTKGDELSDLKCLMDSKGDIFSMHYLVYVQLRSAPIKASILDHIAKQARIQSSLMGSMARRRNMLSWRKILSDIDDTLVSSGGSFPKGVDTNFPKQSIYPGVISFYRELNLGTSGVDNLDSLRHGDLAFLSARPHVYKDVSESATYSKIHKLQKDRGLHTSATLLAGSLDTGSRFLVTKDSESLAQKKYVNFKEYMCLYPEFSCVFIGDNGQGDVRAAELVMNDKEISSLLKRTYIHVVQDISTTFVQDLDLKRYSNSKNVFYFSTYVDAAIDAYEMGFIRKTGLQRLMIEAVRDFFMIPDDNWGMMNVEVIRPLSYHTRQAKKAALNQARSTVVTGDVSDGLVAAAGTVGARPRGDSFSQVVVSAISSLTGAVAGNGGSDNSKNSSSGMVTPPSSSPLLASSTSGKHKTTAASPVLSVLSTPSAAAVVVPTDGIASVSKGTFAVSSSSATTSFISTSKTLFARIPVPSTPNRNNKGIAMTVVDTKTKTAVSETRPVSLPKPSLGFSLLEVWEIHRNRPSVFDGPVSTKRKVSGWTKRELRIRELNSSIAVGNMLLQQLDYRHPGKIDPVDSISYPVVFSEGTVVSSPFGIGTVRSFRTEDGMYEVLIDQSSLQQPKRFYLPTTTILSDGGVVSEGQIRERSDSTVTVSTESASAVIDSKRNDDESSSRKSISSTDQDSIAVGGSIPITSKFTIRLFVPGMSLYEMKR